MNLKDIYLQNSVIKSVIENITNDELILNVDYPIDWNKKKFSNAFIVFSNIQGYEIHEIASHGDLTILGVEIISENPGRTTIKIATKAGYRTFSYTNVNIEWPKKYRNIIEDMFYSQNRDGIVKFVLNDFVRITSGELSGITGSVISIIPDKIRMGYLVELGNGHGDVYMNESFLTLVESGENET